jgi:glycine/D-amino acid oxidase-like deaminating enzyme
VELRRAQVTAPPQAVAGGWRLDLEPAASLMAEQMVLAAGAGCRFLAPELPQRQRASWAGILVLPERSALPRPSRGPWLRHAASRRIVQPRHWQRPTLEAAAAALEEERWIVDAGFAPWGAGLLLGQISLVRPGLATGEPPPEVAMEARLRQGLAGLDPGLAGLIAPYRQVPVAFCTGGLPLAGPLPAAPGLWVFSGFGGAFAQVPVLAPLLAEGIAAAAGREAADLSALARLGTLPG